jgi:hypothetical protein
MKIQTPKRASEKPKAEFDIWERLNYDCDKDAGEFREWCERQHRSNYSITLPKEPWSTWRGVNKIASNLNKDAYDGKHAPEAEEI